MASKQMVAVFGFLAFLGTFLTVAVTLGAIVIVKLFREQRLARWAGATSSWIFGGRGLVQKLSVVALILLSGYGAVLLAASATSREWSLAPGEEKYFCEIDCHLAYSVAGVRQAKTIGASGNQSTTSGTFYVVNLRTRFDEHTISSHRGNGWFQPSPREVKLVDSQGRAYWVSQAAQAALEASQGNRWAPMDQPLRPGESYITPLVFDVPPSARDLKLLILSPTEPSWVGRILIGDESSILHKKVYLRLTS